MVSATVEVKLMQDIQVAFSRACLRHGLSREQMIESLIHDFVRNESLLEYQLECTKFLQSRAISGLNGEKLQAIFLAN